MLLCCFAEVPGAGFQLVDAHNEPVMRPCQFSTQCVEFFFAWESEIELPEIPEIGDGKTFSEFGAKGD